MTEVLLYSIQNFKVMQFYKHFIRYTEFKNVINKSTFN